MNDSRQTLHRDTLQLLIYGMLAVFLMALDHRGHYLQALRQAALQLTAPIYQILEWPQAQWQRIGQIMQTHADLTREVEELRRENRRLHSRQLRMAALERENARLRELLGAVERTGLEVNLAELVRVDLDPFSHRVMINRGRRDGIRPGMTVVDADGLMGQVSEVAADLASVVLITDANHAVPLRNLRNGLRMIAYGNGDYDRLMIRDLPQNADLREGDLLVTSGLGGRFPPGLLVARVTGMAPEAREGSTHFGQFLARPLARLSATGQVLVVH